MTFLSKSCTTQWQWFKCNLNRNTFITHPFNLFCDASTKPVQLWNSLFCCYLSRMSEFYIYFSQPPSIFSWACQSGSLEHLTRRNPAELLTVDLGLWHLVQSQLVKTYPSKRPRVGSSGDAHFTMANNNEIDDSLYRYVNFQQVKKLYTEKYHSLHEHCQLHRNMIGSSYPQVWANPEPHNVVKSWDNSLTFWQTFLHAVFIS